MDAGRLFHTAIRGNLLLENSGLNGSEVSAILATQVNSYEFERITSGLEEQWPNHQLRDTMKCHAVFGDGWSSESPANLEERSEEEQIDESAWSFWPKHDTWNAGWDESYWDDAAHWNYGPECAALDTLPVIQDGNVDEVSEPDEG